MIANSLADRIAQAVRGLGYFDPRWRLRVAFGSPTACTSRGRSPSQPGPEGVRGRRRTHLTLTVRPDWLETVWEQGLAVVPDPVAGQLFVLEAIPREVEGTDGAWGLYCCYQHGDTKCKTCTLAAVRYAGRWWTSEKSIEDCMEQAARSVEVALGLAEEPLPF